MTREEIVRGLKLLEDNMVHFDELQNDKGEWIDVHELLFETIQALSQEPCDDAVSRDAALEKMADYVASGYADSVEDFEEYSRIICQLPSVTQKSETETWNGYHGQITAPKGTFKKIYDDAESEDEE